MAERKLSFLQRAYKSFFLKMLAEYNVNSPAKLSKIQKSEFFTRIKSEWKLRKEDLIKANKVKQPVAKKEQYLNLNFSRPSKAIEPTVKIKRAYNTRSAYKAETIEAVSEIFISEKNPDQTNNLKIKFHPNQFFEQDKLYNYPVVKMPQLGAYLKLPREGRAMGKGFKEKDFYEAIATNISDVEVADNLHLTIPFHNRPYEPDIVLIDKSINLYIDIEIDEPYDGYYRYPTHEIEKDDTRDLFFTESGWVVIKFTERQVHQQERECISLIKDVLNSIKNYELEIASNCTIENQWNYQQAVRWQKSNFREKYLGIEKFRKQMVSSKIEVELNDIDAIEDNLSRTQKYQSVIPQENIAFEDETHKYHHPKDRTGNAEYISVTTVIDRFFPFDIDRFIQTKAKREERTEEDILEEFLKNRDEAAEKGTYLHEQIEHFLKGKEFDGTSKEFRMFEKFYEQIVVAKGFEFVEAEKKVLLEDFNVAGTVDALFKKPNKDEYLIVDWKRSKKLVVDGHPKKYGFGSATSELSHIDNSSYYKYALQQNIYKYILETKYDMPISSMNLIVLHENYDEYHRVSLVNMDKEVAIILNSINHKI
ncbi:hypothetical protein [Olleya marilimosa]|uniref:hypothetical protein n=1 Tax=Olleya marilimosa TaxID=272164 RepID=UPI0030ED571A|tara:strand:- start:16305 stop:18080 length:1776 start_codon:yes stop_codon:yes gene_type:complete